MQVLTGFFFIFMVSATQCNCSVVLNHQTDVVRLNEAFRITPVTDRSRFNNLGVVNGVRQCGGNGRILQWRLELCETGEPGPCVMPVNQFQRGALMFQAGRSAVNLGLLLTNMDASKGRQIIAQWENPKLPQSSVQAGKDYALTVGVAAGPALQGKLVTTQLILYRGGDKQIEACAETDFLVL